METSAENFMQILFKVLIAFIIINLIINIILLISKKLRIYKLMTIYWPTLLLVFIMQASFQTGNLKVTLAYSVSVISMSIFSMIGFEVLGRKFPVKNYIIYYLIFYPITFILDRAGFEFTVVAMPFAIATATPLVHTFIHIHFTDRKKSTRLQKALGISYFLMAIHCINFAIFRMDPGAQLWGWLVAYALYDTLAVFLPSIALENANITENERLQNLVDDRTSELNKTLKENETLLKVVMHDISSPLMTMRFYLWFIKPTPENEEMIEKAKKSQSAMEKIILEVKNIYSAKNRKDRSHLKPVSLLDCFNEVSFIFAQKLEKKNIQLIFNDQLSSSTRVLADQTTLTHSVLSNLVSNGLKFSFPNSIIQVIATEESEKVVLEVKDQGPGISPDIIKSILMEEELASAEGTYGEQGSGFGLSIVKTFIESYGGHIEFNSRYVHTHPQEHGTSIRITLDRA